MAQTTHSTTNRIFGAFVAALEQWVIDTLDQFNVKGERREDRVGVWVRRGEGFFFAFVNACCWTWCRADSILTNTVQ